MDLFLAAGAAYLLYDMTKKEPSEVQPTRNIHNPHQRGTAVSQSLGFGTRHHPQASMVPHTTQITQKYAQEYHDRLLDRRETPAIDRLDPVIMKRNARIPPQRSEWVYKASAGMANYGEYAVDHAGGVVRGPVSSVRYSNKIK